MKKDENYNDAVERVKKRYGLISHPGAETGNIPEPNDSLGEKGYAGYTKEQWLQPDMLPPGLSQPRAALVMALQERLGGDLDQGVRMAIKFLTFLIGDNYELPKDLK